MTRNEFKTAYRAARQAGGAASDGDIWARAQASGLPETVFVSGLLDNYLQGKLPATVHLVDGYPSFYSAASRYLRVAGPIGRLP